MLGCVLGFGGYRDEALDRLQQAMRASPHDPLTWLWTIWRGDHTVLRAISTPRWRRCNELVRLRPEYLGPHHDISPGRWPIWAASTEARAVLERPGARFPEQDPRWQQRPPWLRPEDYALRSEGLRLAAGETP